MDTEDERNTGNHGHGDDSMGMMAMMMAMCAGVLLLFVLLPALGMPLGLLVALGAAALMVYLHGRFMRHGSGH